MSISNIAGKWFFMFDTIAITNLKEKIDIWKKEKYSKIRTKFPERREEFFTTSNIPVDVQYSPLDIMNLDYTKDLGYAGEYPFTRGVQPNMYRG